MFNNKIDRDQVGNLVNVYLRLTFDSSAIFGFDPTGCNQKVLTATYVSNKSLRFPFNAVWHYFSQLDHCTESVIYQRYSEFVQSLLEHIFYTSVIKPVNNLFRTSKHFAWEQMSIKNINLFVYWIKINSKKFVVTEETEHSIIKDRLPTQFENYYSYR